MKRMHAVLARTSAFAILASLTTIAQAQETPPPAQPDAPAADEAPATGGPDIVVTGSRIQRNGYQAPTPTVVATAEQLQFTSPANLTQGLNKLPVFAGSQTQAGSGQGGLGSGGVNNIGSFLNLRNFGTIRTLILLDGRRVPPTNFDGNVDVDTLPQALIQRVDVVTGGASAVYGSDAVTGVVNYVLDRKFTGLKGTLQAGISQYGDDGSQRANIAYGTGLFGDRGHLLLSAEYNNSDGVPAKEERPWFHNQLLTGTGSAAAPFKQVDEGRENDRAFGGLIRRTATINPNIPNSLANMTFNPDGTLRPFDKGAPTNTAAFSSGGDGTYHPRTSLLATLRTKQAFGRFEYDFGGVTAFVQGSYSESNSHHSQATANRADTSSSKVTIFSGNAFLRPEIQSILTANNIPSFIVSMRGLYLGRPDFEINTQSLAGTAGLEGSVGKFKWDVAYTYGRGKTDQTQHGNGNNRTFYAAVDAVDEGQFRTGTRNGNIVCRVTLTNPGLYPGCVPINPFGANNASEAAIAYTNNDTAWYATNRSDDVTANITGDLFNLWAGPVSVALGGEYRKQSLVQTSTVDPLAPVDFTGLRGGFTSSTLAYTGVIVAGANGAQEVWEGNAEVVVPLFKDSALGKSLEVSGAGRYTHYRTSGGVWTWKAGLDYRPIEDLRIRLVASRDIRAPTLFDLFAATQIRNSGLVDPLTGVSATTQQVQGGNANLVPEVARTYTAGIVFSPSFLPGFNISIDYYNIKIDNAIGAVDIQTQIRECTSSGGTSPFCANITRPLGNTNTSAANFPTRYFNGSINAAMTKTQGVDLEASYRTPLAFHEDSSLGIRVLGSYQPNLEIQNFPGAVTFDYAGVGERFSKWRITTEVTLKVGGLDVGILNRWKSGVKWNADPSLIYLDPKPGAYDITDLTLSYTVPHGKGEMQPFFSIGNLFNRAPRILATDSPGQVTPVVAGDDVAGRYFTAGVRVKF